MMDKLDRNLAPILAVCVPILTAGVIATATFLWDTNAAMAVMNDRQHGISTQLTLINGKMGNFFTKSEASHAFARVSKRNDKQESRISHLFHYYDKLDTRVQRLEDSRKDQSKKPHGSQ